MATRRVTNVNAESATITNNADNSAPVQPAAVEAAPAVEDRLTNGRAIKLIARVLQSNDPSQESLREVLEGIRDLVEATGISAQFITQAESVEA
jgi:hypothetical protein